MSSNDRTGYPSEYEYHRRQIADLTTERDELLAEARAKFGRIEELIAERDNLRKLLAAARGLAHGRWLESKVDDISAFWRRVDAALQGAGDE